jgi:polyphenol oxidase
MPFYLSSGVRYYTFGLLESAGVRHGVLTRQGGVSQAPWASLNLGGTVGDAPEHVYENRRRAFRALDRPFESLYDVWQVHSRVVVKAGAPRPPEQPHLQADAILTDRPGVTLFMRFADCTPILLFDPRRRAAGLVHAGWQGTVNQIVRAAVEAMQAEYGSQPGDLLAGIGPSIAAHHYEVGPEVIEQVQQSFGAQAGQVLAPSPGSDPSRQTFDLWAANRLVLEQAGVREIEVAGLCTACNLQDWYSHRAEKGRTGRFGALIAI